MMEAERAPDRVVQRFWRDGFAVVRQVFDPAEILAWRETALAERPQADLLSQPSLRHIVCDERVLTYAEAILDGTPVYFGDSAVAIGTRQGSGFHKDNTDRYDGRAPDWTVERYPLIRFGVYAQPHGELPGGIDFLRGSHRTAEQLAGQLASPDIIPGDLIVWNSRTSHSANSPMLRVLNQRVRPNGLLWRLARKARADWVYRPHPMERVAFFVSYGTSHPLLDRHIAYLKTRSYAVRRMKEINWSEDARQFATSRGLELLQPIPDGSEELHEDYQPFGYGTAPLHP